MKYTMFLLLLSFIITSCDAPVRTRVPSTQNFSDVAVNGEDNGVVTNPDTTGGNGVITGTTGTSGQNDDSQNFPGCEYLSPQYNGGSIGYFGLCQGTNPNQFKTVLAESLSTCYVPVHILNSGNSFKLGRAECVSTPQPDKSYYGTFTKESVAPYFNTTRPELVNGIMVIKPNSLNAYMGCMNAKEDFLTANGCCSQVIYNPSTNRNNCIQANPSCDTPANNYAATVCDSFVQYHSDNYRQVDFR